MAKVYVVTSGEYSDFGIVGIFSTREKAEAARDLRAAADKYTNDEIDEYELDELSEYTLGPVYVATIQFKSGDLYERADDREGDPTFRHPSRCEVRVYPRHVRVASPISQEHANKVAAEQRQKWLREQAS